MDDLADAIKELFEEARTELGELVGRPYNVYRPNYNLTTLVTANEGAGVGENNTPGGASNVQGEQFLYQRNFHVETIGPKFLEPGITNADCYSIFGGTVGLKFGDVLVDPEGLAPTLTLINYYRVKEIACLRTNRIGQICDDVNTPIVPSIRYEWLKIATSERPFTDILAGQVHRPLRKLVCYARPELMPQNNIVQGMRLLETDGTLNPPKRWVIKIVQHIHPLISFDVEEEE